MGLYFKSDDTLVTVYTIKGAECVEAERGFEQAGLNEALAYARSEGFELLPEDEEEVELLSGGAVRIYLRRTGGSEPQTITNPDGQCITICMPKWSEADAVESGADLG